MPVDFKNTNSIWASLLIETLARLGLKTAIVCPGSRSAPLAIAAASHPGIEAIPVLDERSAAFFALGLARQQHQPVALICTSGTAGANFYPAVIEANESQVPLLVLTADRPPELRDCNAGQAIDQHKLYGSFPNWQTELAIPALDRDLLAYLRQVAIHAWERSLYPVAGVVHLNVPLREPLAPIVEPHAQALQLSFDADRFFAAVQPLKLPECPAALPLADWQRATGVIIAGGSQPRRPDRECAAIARLAATLGYPVLAEGLSPLRNHAELNPHLITTYDAILRQPTLAQVLVPEVVIRIGAMPTSKQLRMWLDRHQPRQWIIDPNGRNLDPLHGATTHLRQSITAIAAACPDEPSAPSPYLKRWCEAEAQARAAIDQTLATTTELFEGKAAWLLSQKLPAGTPVFISSSMPVRDVEFFWAPNALHFSPFFNRGANGIDGSLSTALGIAHRQPSAVMLTGDLALLHDTNGFLLRSHFVGHLTIVLINNQGGGIFEMLPIAQFEPPFEQFFATPQAVNFAQLCATYGVTHEVITDWEQFAARLNPLPTSGIRVLEIPTDRKADARWRQTHLQTFAQPAG
jgi:2-succinyl-5-enolpyruvyl-6-hydroxy-3-cyclohexene-1-carboxylate synthase